MPKIAIYKYFVFFIVAYDLLERYHLHIVKTKKGYANAAKLWLDPVEIFKKGDLTEKEINTVVKLITKNEKAIKNQIDNFATGKKVNTIQL